MWLKVPSGQHSQAHIPASIGELKIDFELKVKKSRSLSKVHKLTWVRLCIFIQEGGAVDWNLLGLAAPIAMGQAAGEWASLPWIVNVSSHLFKLLSITCEVVQPPTCPFVIASFVSANWIVTAAFSFPDIAPGWAPFESPRGLCCYR